MGALPVRDTAGDRYRRPQVRVAADPLIEDDQVERAGQEAAEEVERVQAVDEGGGGGKDADLDRGAPPESSQPPWTCGRPVRRTGCGRCARRPKGGLGGWVPPGSGGSGGSPPRASTTHRWKSSRARH